jgi:hypothetical protein
LNFVNGCNPDQTRQENLHPRDAYRGLHDDDSEKEMVGGIPDPAHTLF